MTGTIFELKPLAVHDGDGIRTTVFLKGCPLKCIWCHNPEGISPEPQTGHFATSTKHYGETVTAEQLLSRLLEDRDFYETSGGGVTLSGGECLMQSDFCRELLRLLKAEGIGTAVDTCGFVPRRSIEKVLPYTDTFLYDLKAVDSRVHAACTGVPNDLILENLRFLDAVGASVEIRIPFVPGYNDGELPAMAEFLKTLHYVKKVRVLPYHNYAGSKYAALGMENTLPDRIPTAEEIAAAQELLRKAGLPVA